MKWNATIIVAFFFNPHELTKIVLQKFYKILLHQIALFGLANWTKKVFPVFPRNIPYPARPKGPPSIYFGTARLFSGKFFPQRVPPSIFLLFCDRMDVGKSLSVFFGRDFFPKIKISPLQFFDVLRQKCWQFRKCPPFSAPGARASGPRRATRSIFFEYVIFRKFSIFEYCKREYLTLGSLFAIFEPWIWRRLGPVPACLTHADLTAKRGKNCPRHCLRYMSCLEVGLNHRMHSRAKMSALATLSWSSNLARPSAATLRISGTCNRAKTKTHQQLNTQSVVDFDRKRTGKKASTASERSKSTLQCRIRLPQFQKTSHQSKVEVDILQCKPK